MQPATVNLTIYQGATFTQTFAYQSGGEPVNLTGTSARMHVRERVTSAEPEIELTTANGRISIGDEFGTVTLTLTAEETAAIKAGSYVYDLELVNGPVVGRFLQGQVFVSAEVTR